LFPFRTSALSQLIVLLALSGCVDEKLVFDGEALLEGVPAGAQGFLGYIDTADNLTVCGNCHVGQQGQWVETAHADAWATLEGSGHSQDFCEGCHTVSSLGNMIDENAVGFVATLEERYHDVQCESCHGPGLTHVQNPDATQPLASIQVGGDLTNGCGECHSGAHHPFVEEWAASGHGAVLAYPAGRPECQGCHTAQGAMAAFGVKAEYLEKGSTTPLPITCAVCHDPHSAEFEGQLRYSISVPDEEQNLCMRCHHKRGTPDFTATNRGPHSPQGPLLLGDAGWWPPNMPIEPGERIQLTHGSERNPRLCAGCHVQAFQVEDELTGELVATTGHFFQAIPCVDANGQPVAGDDCALQERSFLSCTASGCHGNENIARNLMVGSRSGIDEDNVELKALLALVAASEFDSADGRYSVAEGSLFNSQLADMPGSEVHNPFLIEALLEASIAEMKRTYGL
jgi:predicted CXXCH cytochrome family protein